jgi:hypothetical protein
MAILTGNVVVACMNLVTECNGLFRSRNLWIIGYEKIEEVSKANTDERE